MPTISALVANPAALSLLTNEEIYSMPEKEVEELQSRLLHKRFEEVRPKIKVVDRLASDLNVERPENPHTITSLCLPHTFYKSYTASDIEKGRFDRLTRWLGTLTTHDLSTIDMSRCDSLESWLAAIQAHTPVRPQCSSGTGGKPSFFPRSLTEETFFIRNFQLFNGGFRSELDSGLASAEVDFLSPWPFATGNHNLPIIFRLLREHVFKHRPGEHVHILGKAHWDMDVMWVAARLRAAEAKGDRDAVAALSLQLAKVQPRVAVDEAETAKSVDLFMNELLVNQRGRKIYLFAPPKEFFALTLECEKRGVKPDLSPDSFVFVPGRANSKGGTLPDGWLERCKAIFPFDYQGVYAMTECTGSARLCPADHFHMPPWVYIALLDPDTSQPYPRAGVQTGRLALFDLLPETYWGGTITGDRVTINWDGGCSCGRIGPYIHNDITRYGSLKDDDKITCSKTTDAYEKAVEYVLGSTAD